MSHFKQNGGWLRSGGDVTCPYETILALFIVVAILTVLIIIGILLYLIVHHLSQLKTLVAKKRQILTKLPDYLPSDRQIYRHKTENQYTDDSNQFPPAAYEPIVIRNQDPDFGLIDKKVSRPSNSFMGTMMLNVQGRESQLRRYRTYSCNINRLSMIFNRYNEQITQTSSNVSSSSVSSTKQFFKAESPLNCQTSLVQTSRNQCYIVVQVNMEESSKEDVVGTLVRQGTGLKIGSRSNNNSLGRICQFCRRVESTDLTAEESRVAHHYENCMISKF